MTPYELLIAAGLYVLVGARYAGNGDGGMALTFVAYALANFGLYWHSLSKV